jgi:arsenate reductase-like glutaredoxin family protein
VRKVDPEVEERNYAKEPLTKKEVASIVDAAGSVAAVLNTRHAVAKERGWGDKPPSKAAFVEAVLKEPNLLRRPILVGKKSVAVGKDEAAIRAALRG